MTYLEAMKVLEYLKKQARQMQTPPKELLEATRIMHDECKRMEKEIPFDHHEDQIPLWCRHRKDIEVRIMHKDWVTGELVCVKKGELTKAEQENHEAIKKQWLQKQ